eukprot:UN13925
MCFSISSPRSFANIESKWLPEVRTAIRHKKYYRPGTPMILVGTKCDLRKDKVTIDRLKSEGLDLVSRKAAEDLVKKVPEFSHYCETSALTDVGVKNTFLTAVQRAVGGKGIPFWINL